MSVHQKDKIKSKTVCQKSIPAAKAFRQTVSRPKEICRGQQHTMSVHAEEVTLGQKTTKTDSHMTEINFFYIKYTEKVIHFIIAGDNLETLLRRVKCSFLFCRVQMQWNLVADSNLTCTFMKPQLWHYPWTMAMRFIIQMCVVVVVTFTI